MMNRQNSLLDQ